jgi:ABC transporter substrate binding protein (PQQ-dependent alcohol dehydrogenase system)
MKKDAEAQWQQKTPGSAAKARAWHPDFVKYAARDLNKRFLETHSVKMNDESWTGWASVKIVSDSVVRQGITDPAKLLNFIKSDLVFDGQKGTDMNFRNTGQLRQILLLVENDKILEEAPVRGVVKPTDLDSLGNIECAK